MADLPTGQAGSRKLIAGKKSKDKTIERKQR